MTRYAVSYDSDNGFLVLVNDSPNGRFAMMFAQDRCQP
jgi:hypothetical protein